MTWFLFMKKERNADISGLDMEIGVWNKVFLIFFLFGFIYSREGVKMYYTDIKLQNKISMRIVEQD